MGSKAIFIDTETGGLEPRKHSILTLGAICIDTTERKLLDTYYAGYIYDTYTVTPQALRINGIKLVELVSDPQSIHYKTGATEFGKWLDKQRLATNRKILVGGHNVNFDKGFVIGQLGLDWDRYFHYRVLDSQTIAAFLKDVGILHLKSTGLDAVATSLGVRGRENDTHNALEDAKLSARCYLKMVSMVVSEVVG